MAGRKRRTYLEPEKATEQIPVGMPVWETAIYARLSIENSGKNDGGDSIESQIEICREYISEHPYLHYSETYCDNGWTGTNTDRPEFQRLLADIRDEKIKALVIKDFSRFSRDYIEAGNLLENIFPAMGVRFISVVDRYDSFETDGSASSLLIPLKNLINSFYSRDQSKKVSLAVHAKQLAGEHIPSMIPYGYRKSQTEVYRFEPDPETAPVVKMIFEKYLAGTPGATIRIQLNREGIPSPGKLRYMRGQTNRHCYADCLWTDQVIKQILRNPTYMGDLCFGRMPTALYLGKPDYRYEPDESKWRILPDMHEALVSRADFYKAREILKEKKETWDKKMAASAKKRAKNPPFFKTGMVRCGHCGGNMIFYRPKEGNVYRCHNIVYNRCDVNLSVKEELIKGVVWQVLQDQMALYADLAALAERLKNTDGQTKEQKAIKEKINAVSTQLSRRQKSRERLYEDYADGILTPEDYITMKKRFEAESSELASQLNVLNEQANRLNRSLSFQNKWLKNMELIHRAKVLTPEIAEAMVDHINVYRDDGYKRRIEVALKYQEDRLALEKAFQEMKEVD